MEKEKDIDSGASGVVSRIKQALEDHEDLGSVSALARAAGISERTIYKAFNKESELRDDSLAKIANALGVSSKWLKTGMNSGHVVVNQIVSEPHIDYAKLGKRVADGQPSFTVTGACEFLAEQFGLESQSVMDAVMELVRAKGKDG